MRYGGRTGAPTSPRPGRWEHTTRTQRSRGRRDGRDRRDRRAQWPLWFELSALALLLAASIPSNRLMQHGRVAVPFEQHASARGRSTVGPALSSTPTTLPTPTTAPTPTPTPDSNLAANLRMGCTFGKPPVLPGVIFHGTNNAVRAAPPQEVALTFDDGPTPYSTPPILSYLEQTHTPATFFVEGQYVHLWPYLVQREWRDGFAVGIHTWDHPDMTRLSPAARRFQLGATLTALHAALGQHACIWFWRPPYGAYNAAVVQTATSFGLSTIWWDVDPRDWSRPGTSVIVRRVLGQVHPGAIILLHDGPALRDETRAALPGILAGLRARGLTPVTL
ncbi:MAG TPA: polysaccharide deacetylase family protein, partial [Ktedonobacterales bacterium]|nr:polysaccharide deacetylase family protein [Ktedonobacterales bacterium]